VRRLTLVLALIGSLLFATSASAHARDANRDRIPDRWEKRHGLSLKVKQTRRDQDRDGFRNRAEWRARTDPRDPDTDDDGIEDADENAGTVTAFANGDLTITLFAGGALTGKVTEDTEIECDDDDAARASGDDDEGDDDHGDRDEDEHGDDHGDVDEDEDECDADALRIGTVVEEAELEITSAGRFWEEVELR